MGADSAGRARLHRATISSICWDACSRAHLHARKNSGEIPAPLTSVTLGACSPESSLLLHRESCNKICQKQLIFDRTSPVSRFDHMSTSSCASFEFCHFWRCKTTGSGKSHVLGTLNRDSLSHALSLLIALSPSSRTEATSRALILCRSGTRLEGNISEVLEGASRRPKGG